jgi:hypothetical protein
VRSRLALRSRLGGATVRAACQAIACLAAAFAAGPLAASPFAVHVTLTPAVIGLEETATLTIEAEGGGLSGYSFEPTYLLENLAVAGGPSRFTNFSLINGSLSHSFRYSLPLRPLATGPARVRSLVLRVHDQVVRLPDQEIRVQEQPTGQAGGGAAAGAPRQPGEPEDLFDQLFGRGSPFASPQRPQGPAAFLRAELQPARPLAGEQAIYTIYLYSRQDVSAISPTAIPSFKGFWVRDLPQPEHYALEMMTIGNDRYGRVPMIRKALFALRPGHHVLEPATCDVVVEPPGRGFFGPPVPLSEELHLRTPEMAVDVQPLPSAPAGFGGLVGQVSLASRLQPYKVHLGDGTTLTVTLAGAGHLQGVAAPRLDLPPGLTTFPPQQQSEDHVNGATVEGRRTWTYVIVPTRPGLYSVKPQSVAYFDPAHRAYRLAESPALALTALPAPPAPPAAGAAGAAGAAAGGTLHAAGGAGRRGRGPLAWLSQLAWLSPRRGWPGLLPWIALLGGAVTAVAVIAFIMVRRHGHPQSARRTAPASAGLNAAGAAGAVGAAGAANGPEAPPPKPREVEQKLREAAREERPRHAAALVEEGWRGYLAGRWGLPSTTPPARWGAVLAAQGVGSDIADEVTRLVEELHYLRYAPQLSTTGAVRDQLLSRSRQLLRRLR